jgi:DNA-binding response OmpR family regulator
MDEKTVVICDDNTTFRHLMKQLFERKGFRVRTAGDGDEGLSLIRSYRPDFLLLDLEMPTDGASVLESLQTLEGKRPYTIVISVYTGAERRRRAAALGAQEFWEKPFNAFDLTSRVRSLAAEEALAAAAAESSRAESA